MEDEEKMEKTNLTYENRLIIENGIEKRLSFASRILSFSTRKF